ncbi:MAG: response regulator [Proteobacteria bacterium]|nr:response regulator [Pseudomonadota bacterium]
MSVATLADRCSRKLFGTTAALLGLLWAAIAASLQLEYGAVVALPDPAAAVMLWQQCLDWTVGIGLAVTTVAVITAWRFGAVLRRHREEERRLEDTRRKLIDTLEATGEVYFELDSELAITDVAPRICEIAGLQPSDLIGLKTDDLRASTADNKSSAELKAAIGGRKPIRNIDLPIVLPGGRQYWIRSSGAPIFDDTGAFRGYRCMASGITEAEIDKSRELQQDRMSALGHLAGGIAHDFNNLLTSIIGFAALLEEDLKHDPSKRKLAERILHSGNRAKQLVERILAFARRSSVTPEVVRIGDVIAELVPLLKATLPATVDLESAIEVKNETVLIAPSQLNQLVLALGANAGDALGGSEGAVRLSLTRVDPHGPACRQLAAAPLTTAERIMVVTLETGQHQLLLGQLNPARPHVCLTVEDSGAGIAPELLGSIFDPYFTTKSTGKGAGLGLAVVHGVVLDAGCALRLTTAPGLGTTVEIFLPIEPLAPAGPGTAEASWRASGARVLLVDDEPVVLEMLGMTLQRIGMRVRACRDRAEAWSVFEVDPQAWDAVMTDQGTSSMRGVELIRLIKGRRPDIGCALYTGSTDAVTEDVAYAGGADIFLRKPMPPVILQQEIAKLTGARPPAPLP